ncbi:major facilitator superfamily domain-containing protein [Mucor mucedo]|uniref:major facilitator superfamily domain-containing protein n=1 Tax=Mucor mucedo TaxID=29922 RepID=UPI00221F9374|nr:major facilitator superfamily domain-containing protein [Mucor mucedo]KAI7878734.1 major facilitator superfamily domain-containing protein [Mucor mucedo]
MEKQVDSQSFDHSKETLAEDIISEHDSTPVKFVKTPEEKAFVRKLNWTVLPVIFLIVFIQFCDKSALSVAAVLGIKEDNNITGSQFSWVGSIFYLGYLICQVPNNYLIQKYPTGRYLGSVLIVWGFVMAATALCHTFSQLMALRFLLGLFEGVTYPCVYIILNTLYRRSEQSSCWGFLGISTGMGTVFGVLIAYGLYHMDNIAGLRAWRWGYIVFGIMTVLIGILTFFCLVDNTHHKLLRLTEKELDIVEERTRDNCVVRVKEIKSEQRWEALKEPRLYLIFFMNLFNCLQNGGLVTFSTILVEGLGFSAFNSIILQIPNGVVSATFAIGAVWVANRVHHTTFTAIGTASISLVGCIILSTVPGMPKLVGLYLSWAMTGVGSLTQTLVSTNVSGYTKRNFYNAVNMVAMTFGNFIGPLLMIDNQAPGYFGAMTGFSIANAALIVCLIINYILMKNENKRRIANPPTTPTDVYLDLTDAQDRNILYKL